MSSHKNLLQFESSPYLLQHSGNPVDWHPWGPEALEMAKESDRPIMLSIGYAACHWCHVMERESFEVAETAAIMNKHFINIKVDREERPDLDHIYMDAVQAISGSGGWPLNIFLTPDAKPFYGGTYFPPKTAFGRNSWTDVLLSISDAWENRRDEVESQATQLVDHIKAGNKFGAAHAIVSKEFQSFNTSREDCMGMAESLLKNADVSSGGFGQAPKFPQTFTLQFLLQNAHFFANTEALKHVEFTLHKMINGGIYDQLGGGLSRYSTDAEWLVPHFEKMLYDNALLVIVLSEVFQLTGNIFYKNAIKKTLAFLSRELKDKSGGYNAAIDADSEGVEGKFYVWDKSELDLILGPDSEFFCRYYNVTEGGNWENKNILNNSVEIASLAGDFKLTVPDAQNIIDSSRELLLMARNSRVRPITDDKILLGWNALLLTALCKAFAAVQDPAYKESAIELYDFLISAFEKEDGLYHTFKEGIAKVPAFLDDYAYLIQACIQLQEITSDQNYLLKARSLTEFVLLNFSDDESEFLCYTRQQQADVILRKVEMHDGAVPSANSVMAANLFYLSTVFDLNGWATKSNAMTQALSAAIKKYPRSFSIWAIHLQQLGVGINEIAITGVDIHDTLKEVLKSYLPNRILQSSEQKSELPLLSGKSFSTASLVYLCKDYQCLEPVTSVKELLYMCEIK